MRARKDRGRRPGCSQQYFYKKNLWKQKTKMNFLNPKCSRLEQTRIHYWQQLWSTTELSKQQQFKGVIKHVISPCCWQLIFSVSWESFFFPFSSYELHSTWSEVITSLLRSTRILDILVPCSFKTSLLGKGWLLGPHYCCLQLSWEQLIQTT